MQRGRQKGIFSGKKKHQKKQQKTPNQQNLFPALLGFILPSAELTPPRRDQRQDQLP